MLSKSRGDKTGTRKVTPPGPSYMSDSQMATYLADLRSNRPPRPSGSRPLPVKSSTVGLPVRSSYDTTRPAPMTSSQSMTALPQVEEDINNVPVPVPAPLHRRTQSEMSNTDSMRSRTSVGRPLAQGPSYSSYSIRGRNISPTAVVQMDNTGSVSRYRDSGPRWIEKQEAMSIRDALQEMDLRGEEKKIYDAAQQEAADLVWKHMNPRAAEEEKVAAYKNPDMAKSKYTQHLEKGAHARSQSLSYGELAKRMSRSNSTRSVSDSSASSNDPRFSTDSRNSRVHAAHIFDNPPTDAMDVGEVISPGSLRKLGKQRVLSNGSTKGIFRNPEDEIYEEPAEITPQTDRPHVRFDSAPLQDKQRNSLPRGSRPLPTQPNSFRKRFNPFEIHRNPPSQSRNPEYTQNAISNSVPDVPVEAENPPMKDGLEIRSDDIRAATSMKLKDRSPRLPMPSAVSDRLGRPIVSFDPNWQQKPVQARDTPPSSRDGSSAPAVVASSVPVPSINLPEEPSATTAPSMPTIVLPDDSAASNKAVTPTINLPSDEPAPGVPSINLPDETPAQSKPAPTSARPLPNPSTASKEPKTKNLPWLNRNAPPISRAGVPTATCVNCNLPIAGRVVTASGSKSQASQKARFHPECFTCFHCSTGLEAAEFYPEPENKRAERLEREGLQEGDDGTELRFYCHLDFHEFFSPRCKSCKTPIEGEVIIAAGAEWHVGHFFCAECGDPFDSNKPFVEKDGYAWCVSCHTRRTSSRCRACKQPILDEITITALGGQWHEKCFACLECGGGFGDEGRFFVREVEGELTDKERRRGLKPRMEERAVCRGCEERRLKA